MENLYNQSLIYYLKKVNNIKQLIIYILLLYIYIGK